MNKIILLASLVFYVATSFGGEISFTFDDAPKGDGHYFSGSQRTKALISQLKRAKIRQAAFFCNSTRLDSEGKERLQAYADTGHIIANHSHSHFDLHDTDAATFIADIKRAHDYLKEFSTFKAWFRFPYLREGETVEKRDTMRTALKSLHYRNGYVTVDTYDWYMDKLFQQAIASGKKVNFKKLKETYTRVLWEVIQFYDQVGRRALGRSPKHVLLLHENDLAALFVDALANKIRSAGWQIISAEEAFRDPISDIEPDTLLLGQGRLAAIAHAMGDPGPFQKWQDEFELEKLFSTQGIFE